jgi:hypothetical protein
MPILGTVASQFSGKPSSSFESIATATVGAGGESYVEFTSIPSTFSNLRIILIDDTTTGDVSIKAQFNGDTGSNYSWHTLYGDGGGSAYSDYNGISSTAYTSFARGGNGSGVFAGSIIDILDYKDTSKYKSASSLTGKDNNGNGVVWLSSGSWRSMDAITSIKIFPESGSFKQYSNFALYGMKG